MAGDGRRKPGGPNRSTRRPRAIGPTAISKFLKTLCDGSSVQTAVTAAGPWDRRRWYDLRDASEPFAAAWDEAVEAGTDCLEQEARRRAVEGVPKGVYHQGQRVDTEQQYSDGLLQFLLNGRRPEKYKQVSRVEHTGKDGGPIKTLTVSAIDEAIAELSAELKARAADDPVPVE